MASEGMSLSLIIHLSMAILPLSGSDGTSFEGSNCNMEANEEQCHGHVLLGLYLAQIGYSKIQTLHFRYEAVQMS